MIHIPKNFLTRLFKVTGKTLLALVGVFIAVELLLTLVGGAGAPNVVFVENEGYRYVPNISFTNIDRLSNTLAPVRINAHGFRDDDWEKYSDDSFHQISIIGDSVVAALDTREPRRFTELLELKLSDGSTGRWQVMNMGIGGQQVINYLDQVYYTARNLEADLVVVVLSSGDDFDAVEQQTIRDGVSIVYSVRDQKIIRSTNQLSELQKLKRRILGWVRPFWLVRIGLKNLQLIQGNLFEIIRSHFSAQGKGGPLRTGPVCPATGTVAKENLRLVGRLIQEMKEVLGKKLVLTLVPIESELREYSNDMACDPVRVHRWIEAFAKSHEIPFVRLYEQFMLHQSKGLFIDGGHLNDYGHEVVAEELAKFVRNYNQSKE